MSRSAFPWIVGLWVYLALTILGVWWFWTDMVPVLSITTPTFSTAFVLVIGWIATTVIEDTK